MATNASDALNVATETSTLVHCLGANFSDIDCLKLCAKHAVPQYKHGFVLPGFENIRVCLLMWGGGGGMATSLQFRRELAKSICPAYK